MRGEPPARKHTPEPVPHQRQDSPRSLHHTHNRRTEFGKPEHPGFDVASREGHEIPSPGRQPRPARDPSRRTRDRRDEHVEAGRETPFSERRDAIAHWERASAVNRKRGPQG